MHYCVTWGLPKYSRPAERIKLTYLHEGFNLLKYFHHSKKAHRGKNNVKAIDWLFLVQVQVVLIHNNGDPKRPKGISKAIGEYAHAYSQPPPSCWLRARCSKGSIYIWRLWERPPNQHIHVGVCHLTLDGIMWLNGCSLGVTNNETHFLP